MSFTNLRNLIEINTICDKENNKIIDYIANVLSNKGFKNEFVISKDNKKCLISRSSDECNLCFLGHSDTVNFDNNWTKDPLSLTIDCDNLYGRGVCDMKGGIAAFLDAINNTNIFNLNKGIMVVITYDEEIGFDGINLLINNDKIKDIPNNIIICEPTDSVPITACKGCIEYKVEFKGISTHSSNIPNGINAINIANSFINELNEIYNEIKKDINNIYDISYTTMNISTINGGTSINVVPDYCSITFDFRTILESHNNLINNKIIELCNKYNCKYNKITDVLPSINNSKDIEFIEKITNKKSIGYNYVTEGNFINKNNMVILGPGPVTAHEVDEYISINSYKNIVNIYEKIIDKYCKGEDYE